MAQHRYRSRVDSNLTFLDAQRSLFSAKQALIVDRLAQLVAEVNLYTALGGAWGKGGSADNAALAQSYGQYPVANYLFVVSRLAPRWGAERPQ